MLYNLFEFLEQQYQFPGASVFQYISFRSAMAIIFSMGFSMIFGKKIINYLKRSVNEIYRMLNILVTRNYIELDLDSDRYKLTFKLLQLSSQHQPIKNLMQKSLPMMREVSQLCNHSVHLSIYYAGKLLVIGQVDSPSSFNYSVTTGSTFDLLETSSGRVILAFQTEIERKRRLERRKLLIFI